MDLEEFALSIRDASPPRLAVPLVALWHAARGDWEGAHELVARDETNDAAWVHAYLHRVEGDLSNADYWYRRAGRSRPAQWDRDAETSRPSTIGSGDIGGIAFEEEWRSIAGSLLGGRR